MSQTKNSNLKGKPKDNREKNEQRKQMGIMGLVVALVVVLVGGVLFVGAVSGWFDDKNVVLSKEYYDAERAGLVDFTVGNYNNAAEERKSFVVFVDQDGCTTADRVRGFVEKWAKEKGVEVGRMMFADMKESALHESVKYYPSVAIVSYGKPVAWLRADEDADADAYNDETAFRKWIDSYVK